LFRHLLRFFHFILKTLGILFGLLILIVVFNYLVTERYIFPVPKPFSGEKWYNPYQDMDSLHWRRTNLHMHSRAWGGITNGSDNSEHVIWEVYRKLGYESIGISNYQSINKLYSDQPYYIPVYEHGYGIFKNHQLLIGARKVLWYDLPFGQNIHHKQYILNRLRSTTDMISINHPAFFNGYKPEDFRYLTGYDLLEVLNGYRNSIAHWDSALSAGKPAFLMADDDMHDIADAGEPSRRLMVVNSPDNSRENICSALKKGCALGVEIKLPKNETFAGKAHRLDSLPMISSVKIKGDTLQIVANQKAIVTRFYGQDGKYLGKVSRSSHANWILKPEDTYVRAVVVYVTPNDCEGITLFLNPVIRTSDGRQPVMVSAIVDTPVTWVYRIIGFATVLFIGLNIYILRRRCKRRKTASKKPLS
jgi:hypothetical protein